MTADVLERGAAAAAPRSTLTTHKAAELLGWPIHRVINWADTGRLPCHRSEDGRRRISAEAVARLIWCPTVKLPESIEVYHRGSSEPEADVVYDACGDEWIRCFDGLWRLADARALDGDMAQEWGDLVVAFYPIFSHRWP